MKILIRSTTLDGEPIPGSGETIQAADCLEVVELMRGQTPFTASRAPRDYMTEVLSGIEGWPTSSANTRLSFSKGQDRSARTSAARRTRLHVRTSRHHPRSQAQTARRARLPSRALHPHAAAQRGARPARLRSGLTQDRRQSSHLQAADAGA